MQYCLSRKPEEYEVTHKGICDGLWRRYGHNPSLFNLLSRTSVVFFMYEQGFESLDIGKRIVALNNIDAWEATLESPIKRKTVREWIDRLSPREFSQLVLKTRPRRLPIYAVLPTGDNDPVDILWFIMNLRTLQHEKYYRGTVHSCGSLTRAAFASRLAAEEDRFLETHKILLLKRLRERPDAERNSKLPRVVKKID